MRKRSYRQKSDKPIYGDTFSVYYGLFLNSPVPVELSFSFCSHLCSYCFANINKPGRWSDTSATMRTIANARNSKTLLAHLLNEGYPTLLSNRVDPFAASNYRTSVPVMELMTQMGMPVAFQTRGGYGIDETLQFIPKSVWYISVPFLSEELRKTIEPGAPSIASRLDLITKLRNKGHIVSAAANPYVPEWEPDHEKLMRTLRDAGAESVWIEELHFSQRQADMMPKRWRDAIGEGLVSYAKKVMKIDFPGFLVDARESAKSAGLHVYTTSQHEPTEYFDCYEKTYAKVFPTFQGFLNECHRLLPNGGEVSFIDFAEYMVPRLPKGKWQVHHYIGASSKDVLRDDPMPSLCSYLELLARAWFDVRTNYNPARNPCFAYKTYNEDGAIYLERDEDDMPLMLFDPSGSFYWHCSE